MRSISGGQDASARGAGGTPAVPPRPPRDLRLDAFRGWLQLTIFMAHAALMSEGSSRLGGWIVHTAWGYSDSSEQFVFTSGFGLGSVFALKFARDGAGPATADLLRRTGRLYRTHLLLFAVSAVLVIGIGSRLGVSGDIDAMGWRRLLDRPGETLLLAAALVYQPRLMEILPVFIVCMLLVGPFLLLVESVGDRALALPVALYAATHLFGLVPPAIGREDWPGWGFNPLAWQLLYLFGAWLGRRSLHTQGKAVPRHPLIVGGAVLGLVWAFLVRIATYGWWPAAWLPFGWVPPLNWLIIKENLGPILLLHGLAIAYLCATLIPRDLTVFSRGPFRMLTATGRHSLEVFCLGACLSWGVSVVLRRAGYSTMLDAALLAGGCALLMAFGAVLDARRLPAAVPASPRRSRS